MATLASGDISLEVPYLNRNDEIGEMASSVQVFKENAIKQQKLEEQQREASNLMEQEKQEMMEKLADTFKKRVEGIIHTIASAATELNHTAENMNDVIAQSSDKTEEAAYGHFCKR